MSEIFKKIYYKRRQIVKDAVEKTIAEFSHKNPQIYRNNYYGSYDYSPHSMVIWYIFKTDKDLAIAKESGMCNEIIKATISNLISLGYPKRALPSLSGRKTTLPKASIEFTTHEDIERETGGDYWCYFK